MKIDHSNINMLMDRLQSLSNSQDDDSPLEILFSHYSEFCNPQIQDDLHIQKELREVLLQCVPEQADQIMDLIHMICFHYERINFISGLKAGVRLATELTDF